MPYNGKATGAIFQNGRKQKDSHPDYTGEIELGPEVIQSIMDQKGRGEEFPKIDIAGWKKTTKNGDMFLSVNANPPYEGEKGASAPSAPEPARMNVMSLDELAQQVTVSDDKIPF